MKTNGLAVVAALCMAWLSPSLAQDIQEALRQINAPAKEFVRTPASFVLDQLVRRAVDSDQPSLANFSIGNELPGSGERRVSIDLSGKSLFDAIEAVAKAVGAGVEYRAGSAVLKDPSDIAVPEATPTVAAVPQKPAAKSGKPERVPFAEIGSALVFVDAGGSRVSAFLASMDGKTYVFSNQRNFVGAKSISLRGMDGRRLKPVSLELCGSRDLVRFEVESGEQDGVRILDLGEETPSIGQRIAVYGNSADGNVAKELLGKVVGVGPQEIEIDAKIAAGNSGGPVLDAEGRVLGVAAHVEPDRKFAKDDYRALIYKITEPKDARRYAVRIPHAGWRPVSVDVFLDQCSLIEDMERYLEALYVLVHYWFEEDEFDAPASRLIKAYARIGPVDNPPYVFRRAETEQMLQTAVRGFKQNHDEIEGKFKDMHDNQKESVGGRINHLLRKAVASAQERLDQTAWLSPVLKKESVEQSFIARVLSQQLESTSDPYIKYARGKEKK